MQDNLKTVLEAGAALGAARAPTGNDHEIPFVTVPDDYQVQSLEHLLPQPTRKRAAVHTTQAGSFIDYTKKHGRLDDCTLYADVDTEASRCKLIAVINDHGADEPHWRDHTCSFEPKQAVEWKRWIAKNKQAMTQSDFAVWLEDNLADIASVEDMPTGAEILAMALAFQATADKRMRSKINLQSGGVQFEFVEDEDKDTRTRMQVFERFTLGLPVFYGSPDAYPLEARLKYREKDGKITFWYELIRPDRVFKTAVEDELQRIQAATGFPLLYGQPGL